MALANPPSCHTESVCSFSMQYKQILNLDTGLSFLSTTGNDGSSNVEEAMKGNTVNNPVTLLASGGCTADLVTTSLMSLQRHKPLDMNGTQPVNYPTI